MKFHILSFFLIIQLIKSSITSSVISEDCKKLNIFLKNSQEINYCDNGFCNTNGKFFKLNFKINCLTGESCIEIKDKLDFSTFPIFQELEELNIDFVEINSLPNVFFELPKLNTLIVTNSEIFEIVDSIELNTSIKRINLSNNKIQSFPYQFKNVTNLTFLDLSNNEISGSITEEIAQFHLIKELNLHNNNIIGELIIQETNEKIDVGNNKLNKLSYNNIYSPLIWLDVSDNEFDNTIFDTILKLKNLDFLNLRNNKKIDTIPQEISTLYFLSSLNISGLSINEIPSNIFKLSLNTFIMENNPQLSAKIINFKNKVDFCSFKGTFVLCYAEDVCRNFFVGLNNKKICTEEDIKDVKSRITEDEIIISQDCKNINTFFNFTVDTQCCNVNGIECDGYKNVVTLSVANEYLKSLTNIDKFPFLPKLRQLNISNYKLNKIPDFVFELPLLKTLRMDNAEITEIPKKLNPNSPLEYIYLSYNPIKEFPIQFINLQKLKFLSIEHDEIIEVPKEFSKFPSIEVLYIGSNDIHGTLYIPKTLKELYISSNKIHSLQCEDGMNSIEILKLGGNEFDNTLFDTLIKFKNLKKLVLNSCKNIESIPPTVAYLKKLEYLSLYNMNLRELHSNIFKLQNLKELDISNNNLLNTKIINFGQEINKCSFENTNIICYQSGTCNNINVNSKFPECSDEQIKEVLDSQTILDENINENEYENLNQLEMPEDCKQLYSFLGKKVKDNCCIKYYNVECVNGKITYLNINKYLYSLNKNLNFDNFPLFSMLEYLVINLEKVDTLSATLFDLPKLKKLEIYSTPLKKITEDFNVTSPIKNIILNYCDLSEFPIQFEKLQNLETLNLNHNNLSGTLPKNISSFPKLTVLEVRDNKLEGQLTIFKNLQCLFVDNNKFDSLSYEDDNSAISNLNLYKNHFNNDAFKTLIKFKKLLFLNLDYNKNITKIPESIEQLTNLNNLSLAGLSIKELPNNLFKLSYLEFLNLSDNQELESIPQSIENLTSLKELLLSNTGLKSLPSKIFNLHNLRNFLLGGNYNLKAKIINFGNSEISNCSFENTPLECYQPNTCSSFPYSNVRVCTQEEVDEILDSQLEVTDPNDLNIISNVNEDCKKLNTFLNKPLNTECCKLKGITCYKNVFITNLKIDKSLFNSIRNVDFEKFPYLPKLRILEMYDISMEKLPKTLFDLPSLLTLEIYNTNLKEIPKVFNTTSPIREIKLYSNRIKEFPYQLKNLPDLLLLSLNYNMIEGSLKEEIMEFSFLETLEISNNNMKGSLIIPKSLIDIDVSQNKFDSISCNFYSTLISLNIGKNLFRNDVFETITKFKNLKSLFLTGNVYINEIPQSIGNLINLNQLFLNNINIKALPSNIFKLNNLELIDISDNPQLSTNIINFGNSTIDICKFGNTNIQCYQPETCNLQRNPYKLCTKEEIKEILQSQTEIEINDINNDEYVLTFECKIFNNFMKLPLNINCCKVEGVVCDSKGHIQKLTINGEQLNNANEIDFDKFPNLIRLSILEINSFNIDVFPKSIFELTKLIQLSIINCNINIIPDDIEPYNNIRKLVISGTNLKELPSNLYKFNYLEVLELENNPQLKVELINFNNSPLENCFFRGTPISCYQPDTCMKVDADKEIELYNNCSTESIKDILENNSEEEKSYDQANEVSSNNLSTDCSSINKFFNKKENINCCDVIGFKCDIDNNIVELNLNKQTMNVSGNLNFNEFPLLQNLRFLKLRYFIMNDLSPRFFELPKLESLYILDAKLKKIPAMFNYRSPIQNLDFYNNLIREFPYQLSNLKNLRYLSLGNNVINEELTDNILKFKSIKYLKINNNKFSGKLILPSSLQVIASHNNKFSSLAIKGTSNSIERFYLDNNLFDEKIFNELIKLQNLQWLYLMNNINIKTVPPTISNLTNLNIIDIKKTGIEILPSNFFKLSKLRRLYLKSNSIKFKIIKFVNSPIYHCSFDNTPISCMEPETCSNIDKSKYEICSEAVIKSIKESQTIESSNEEVINGNKNDEIKYKKDCEMLKEFLDLPSNTNCCNLDDIVTCEDNKIIKLQLNMNENDKTDFSKFPIFEDLSELEINNAKINTLPSVLFDLPNLHLLNINKSNITEITNEINPECPIEYINLSDNKIKKFPYQFGVISHLKLLNLMNNDINEELQNEIVNFSSLESIFIDNNHFNGVLHVPVTVETFTANNNKFNSISISNSNYSLKVLELKGNDFNGDVFNSLIQFKALTNLDLSYNKKLRSIPQSIGNLDNLKELTLKETNLKELPYGIFTLPNLSKLNLESSSSLFKIINFKNQSVNCYFGDTPISCYQPNSCNDINNNLYRNCTIDEIKEVKSKLSIIPPQRNGISEDCKMFNAFVNKKITSDCCEEFGVSCDQNDSIKKLYINNDKNSIMQYYVDNSSSIDFQNFPYLKHIENLEIINVELKSIPNALISLPLKKLTLNKNNLMGELPEQFINLHDIQEINLNENKLSGTLLIPKTVKTIYANDNHFDSIVYIKSKNSLLQKLDASNNDFNDNVFNILAEFKNLKYLNLNNNKNIQHIPSSLKEFNKIETLKLEGINIKKFPYELFTLENLTKIQIDSSYDISAKIILFYKSPDVYCNFGNIKMECYMPSACYNIPINSYIRICTEKDINELSQNYAISSGNLNQYVELNNNNQERIENGNIIIGGINDGIVNGFEVISMNGMSYGIINEIDSSMINDNKNKESTEYNEMIMNKKGNLNENKDKENTEYNEMIMSKKGNLNEKTNDKNSERNSSKYRTKNRKKEPDEDDNMFFYIVIGLISVNAVIIITLTVICLLGYKKTKKNTYQNINDIDDKNADIIISEKFTVFKKEDLKHEESLLLKNNTDLLKIKERTEENDYEIEEYKSKDTNRSNSKKSNNSINLLSNSSSKKSKNKSDNLEIFENNISEIISDSNINVDNLKNKKNK